MSDMYHTCRWCRWALKNKGDVACGNPIFLQWLQELPIHEVAEEGKLSGVIEEAYNSVSRDKIFHELETKLRSYKMSEKRIKEVKSLVDGLLNEWLDYGVKYELDEKVSQLYQNWLKEQDQNAEIEITDPDNFYCCRFE